MVSTELSELCFSSVSYINPLNDELNPIYHLLALLGAHHILHVIRIRVNLTFLLKPSLLTEIGLKLKVYKTGYKVRQYIPIVKPTRRTCFSNYLLLHNTLHVSDGLSVHHQEFKTVHTATGICQTDTAACLR
jgi:hypothetical protein